MGSVDERRWATVRQGKHKRPKIKLITNHIPDGGRLGATPLTPVVSPHPHPTAGAPEKAVAHYQQAIQLNPSHHVAVVNLGRLYRSLGQNSMAEEWYKR